MKKTIQLLSLLAVSCGTEVQETIPGPHVVLVVVDTLRADHLGSHGYERQTDSGFQDFLDQATLFEQCLAPAPWTSPSTASILTGLFPRRHGTSFRGAALSPEATTLPELLQAAGWHGAGFSHNHNVSQKTGFDQGFDDFFDFHGKAVDYPNASEMISAASDWLDGIPSGRRFLYLQPMNVHGPYRVPWFHSDELLGRRPEPHFRYYKDAMQGILKEGNLKLRKKVDEEYVASLTDQYDVAIHYTVDQLGELFDDLRTRGLWEDCLVVVTSDHGEELFDHGGFSHGYSLHEEVLHVPLIVKLPGQKEARRVSERVSSMDVLPTIMDVLGLPLPSLLDGRSLKPFCDPKQGLPEPPVQLEFAAVNWKGRCEGASVVDWPWKLIHIERNYEGQENVDLLYHLGEDPEERNDLAADHPEEIERLKRLLLDAMANYEKDGLPEPPNVEHLMDQEVLEALGYK